MSADLLRRAADAMVAEAERLEALDRAAVPAPWYALGDEVVNDIGKCTCNSVVGYPHEAQCGLEQVGGPFGTTPDGEAPDADLAAHRRNSLARDAATLRATADLLRKVHARHAEILSDFKADSEAAQVIAYANTPFMRFAESLSRTFLGEQS